MAPICVLLLFSAFMPVEGDSVGELLDKKIQDIKGDINLVKMMFGNCMPCKSIPNNLCDCRNLEPKKDCLEFYQAGLKFNGIYRFTSPSFNPLYGYCDQTTQGGGWTVIQRRKDGSENFYRNWTDYKHGFGNLNGEYWFGNDNIFHLMRGAKTTSLLINLKLKDQRKPVWAKYNKFSIGDEPEKYVLTVSGFSGNTTDQLSFHNNMKFSTFNQDNDAWGSNCAVGYGGGWWYKNCIRANLNGLYGFRSGWKNLAWGSSGVHAEFTEMKVRRNI